MGIEHTAAVPSETDNADSSSALMITIKASGLLTLLGLVVGIGLAVVWTSAGGGDSIAFAAFATIVCLILGGLFGTLGTAFAYLMRNAANKNLWVLAATFAAPSFIVLLLINMFSLSPTSLLVIAAVTLALAGFGRWFVAPRIVLLPS